MALEPAVGDVFEYEGKAYECVKESNCTNCDILNHNISCAKLNCIRSYRKDNTSVSFKLVSENNNPK